MKFEAGKYKTDAFEKKLKGSIENEVRKAAIGFYSNITKAWPVDTGFSKGAWEPPKLVGPGIWEVNNPVEYAPMLWRGRHTIGNRAYGSEQMPLGGYPILVKILMDLQKNIKKIKA